MWLHGIPITTALVTSIILLCTKGINSESTGACVSNVYYDIPHCVGIEVGEIREGFEIPCGRGDGSWGVTFFTVVYLIITFGVPIVVLASLAMMYSFVKSQEMKMTKYGVGGLNIETTQPTPGTLGADGDCIMNDNINRGSSSESYLRSTVTFTKNILANYCFSNHQRSKSRLFVTRAVMYSISYFLSWIWIFIQNIYMFGEYPIPLSIIYLTYIFNPLQGVS